MDDMSDSWRITDDQAASRLELAAEGQAADVQLAELVYRRSGSRLVLVHTGVPRALEGRGVGGALIRAAVAKAAAEGLTVVPLCRSPRTGWSVIRRPPPWRRSTWAQVMSSTARECMSHNDERRHNAGGRSRCRRDGWAGERPS
jgi:predicted GNAT family acetyltransferase